MSRRPRDHVPFELDVDARRFVQRHPHGATHDAIAAHFGLTHQRIQQLEASALAKLAIALSSDEGAQV